MKKAIILLAILLMMPIVLAYPQFSGESHPNNNTQYRPSTAANFYGFQIKINDTANCEVACIQSVKLENNFNGTTWNATGVNNTAGIFWVNFTVPTNASGTVGSYTYKWFAVNGSTGIENVTSSYGFYIRKNVTVPVHVNITTFGAGGSPTTTLKTGTEGASSYEGQGNVWANCWLGTSSGTNYTKWGTTNLFKSGSSWTKDTSGAESLGKGTYTIKCNSTGNTNYTNNATGISFTLTILSGGGGGGGAPSLTLPTVTVPAIGRPKLPSMPSLLSQVPEQIRMKIQQIFSNIGSWIENIRLRWQHSIMSWFRIR